MLKLMKNTYQLNFFSGWLKLWVIDNKIQKDNLAKF
jgi:hypothetical protein